MESSRIKEMPATERPRERFISRGGNSLTDAELLALFIGSGTVGANAIDVANLLIREFGSLTALSRCSIKELQRIKGIGPAKATHLAAAIELGKRLSHETASAEAIDTPERVYALVASDLQSLSKEHLRVILLNTRHRLIRMDDLSIGSINECIADPREILKQALLHSAYAFVLAHNHPSGDPTPSSADRRLTRRLKEAAAVVNVEFLDHVIIGLPSDGHTGYFSFKEMGLL